MKKTVLVLTLVSLVAVLCFCGVRIVSTLREYENGAREYSELREKAALPTEKEEADGELDIDFAALKAVNPDIVCWLDIPDTAISYPVVQSGDNEYYLRRTVEGSDNVAGSVFMDYRCSPDFIGPNAVIYGHRMRDGTMFGSLLGYAAESYLAEHPEIHIYTESGLLVYKVVAAYATTTDGEAYARRFESDEAFTTWQTKQLGKSFGAGCRVLTLSTCTGAKKERFVVQAILQNGGDFTYSVG